MSSFVLKLIGIITMTIDHLGYTIWGGFSYLNYIGRLAFPIFAFGISEGYLHTKSKKNYLLRLLILGIIAQTPYMMFSSTFTSQFHLNIFFTLFLGLLAIIGYNKCNNKWIGLLLVACLGILADTFKFEYGLFGIFMIFIFYIFKEKKLLMNISFVALCLVHYIPLYIINNFYYAYLLLAFCTILALIPINLYNGKKGINTKYLLYGFYPVHLVVLYIIHILCFS